MAITNSDGSITLSTKVDTSGIKSGMNSLQGMVGKIGVALAAAFSVKKVYDFVKASVDAFAEYEQLVGGVETLFKESSGKVLEYANQAFATTGMSANEYMQNVTSFSASLLSSLGGDTDAAADIANAALISISDNANKMGSDMESVTNAFQGFAKQQYMLLDNLKLGYGGTKTEMERLLKDAQAITGVEYNIDNLADVYTAIGVIQEKLGIAGTTAKEAETTISGSAAMMKAAWENTLVAISSGEGIDRAINNLVYSIQKYFENIVPVVQRSLIGIGQLVEGIAPLLVQTVAQSLIKAMPSLIAAVYQMLIGIATGIYQGIIDLFSGTVNETLEVQAESISASVDNQNALTKAVKDTNKELKKSLAGFDDLQILSSGASDAADSGAGGVTGGATVSTPSVSPTINNETTSKITDELAALMTLVGVALVAIGLILLFTGNIPLGIGFIIAGASSVGASAAQMGGMDELSKAIENVFTEYGEMIAGLGAALIVLGIILCATGTALPLGIGLISLGAMAITGAVYANWDSIVKTVENIFTEFGGLIAGAGIALIVIGILLTGINLPLGIALIAVGAVGLVTTAVLNWDSIVTTIKNFFFENPLLVSLISSGMLAIGLLLLAVNLPLGIALIAFGAAGLITEAVLNWDTIVSNIKNFFFENPVLISLISGGLLVLGIILVATGINLPLGIALIAAGAIGLVTTAVLNWDSIVEWVKSAWNAVKNFWNTHIAKIFTAAWWKNLGITCINGLIAGFEGGINGIIWAFESMINWIVDGINSISFDIPDWVPGIGGDTFGFNIPKASFSRVSIPRLAQGAVIPANREFLAVLGDQRQGVNIETPLETMIEAFQIALDSRGGTGTTEVVLEIDGREFGRAVVEQGNRENRRIGTRLVIV